MCKDIMLSSSWKVEDTTPTDVQLTSPHHIKYIWGLVKAHFLNSSMISRVFQELDASPLTVPQHSCADNGVMDRRERSRKHDLCLPERPEASTATTLLQSSYVEKKKLNSQVVSMLWLSYLTNKCGNLKKKNPGEPGAPPAAMFSYTVRRS